MKNKMLVLKNELLYRLKELKFNNFFRYLKYSIKNCLRVLVFLLVIGFAVYILPIMTMSRNDFSRTTNCGLIVTFAACSCYFIPLLQNNFKMNKRSIDIHYSLPIGRFALNNVKIITGLFEIIVSYSALYLVGFLIANSRFDIPNPEYYIPLYFSILALCIPIYLYNYFIVSRANTITDAVLLLIMNTFVLSFIFLALNENMRLIREWFGKDFSEGFGIPFYAFIYKGNFFNNLILEKNREYDYNLFMIDVYPYLLGLLGYFGILFASLTDKGESSQEVDNSIFGYKTMLPIYLIFFMLIITESATIYTIALGPVFYYVLQVVRYRKFRIPKKEYVILSIVTVISIIIGIICDMMVV